MNSLWTRLALALGSLLGLASHGQALAAGTTAGTTVSNTATVNFSVGGVAQPAVNTPAPATFVVDRRVNLTVAEVGGTATQSAPGSVNQVTTFTVTNSTNAALDFRLIASQDASGATTAFGDTDDFNANNVRVFADVNGNGVYDPATDTATFVDELAADAVRTVFVVVDIPAGQANNSTAGVTLTAVSAASGTAGTLGGDLTETAGADTAGVDTVFGDVAGDTDAARDGRHSDDDEYDILAATISLTKSSRLISDPFNNLTNPKAIPGAVVEYCIQIANSGGASATAVSVADTVPANTAFVASSLVVGGTVTAGSCNADGTAEDDNNAGADESDPNGGNVTAGVVTATVPSVAAGATTTARFRVTVN